MGQRLLDRAYRAGILHHASFHHAATGRVRRQLRQDLEGLALDVDIWFGESDDQVRQGVGTGLGRGQRFGNVVVEIARGGRRRGIGGSGQCRLVHDGSSVVEMGMSFFGGVGRDHKIMVDGPDPII